MDHQHFTAFTYLYIQNAAYAALCFFVFAEDVLQGRFLVRPDSLRHVFLIRNPSYTYRITRKVAWDCIRRFLSFRPVSYVPYSKNPRIRT